MAQLTHMAQESTVADKEPSLWATTGERGRREAQRKLMLEVIAEVGWNLHAIGRKLGIKAPNVIAALQDVAPLEYESAKRGGLISKGSRE